MKKNNTPIDSYIQSSAGFARPILKHLRQLVHKICPDVEEMMKWSFPHFDYRGEMMCSMASFKEHCVFGFWKASLMKNSQKLFKEKGKSAMGQLGQIRSLSDLPSDEILTSCIREAMKLNDDGVKIKKAKPVTLKYLVIPDYFSRAIIRNKNANDTFENFSPSNKREYLDWIMEAKTETTRNKRLDTALEWMSEGKSRNWKYIKK